MDTEPVTTTEPRTQPPPVRRGWFRRLLGDVWFVVRRDKKSWLLPLIVLLLVLAAIFAAATGLGPLAPFLYPLL